MTDLVPTHTQEATPVDTSGAPIDPVTGAPILWGPAPQPRRRRGVRIALWVGIPTLALAGVAGFLGATLIAPGTTVAGVDIGGLTEGAAADRITQVVADTGVELTVGSTTATVTGRDLGATVDARALAAQAHADHPLWQVGGWYPDANEAAPTTDPKTAADTLSRMFAAEWTAPVDAAVEWDGTSAYAVVDGKDGTGLTTATASAAYTDALLHAEDAATLTVSPEPLVPDITTASATAAAEQLNEMVADAGFYVGDERTVPVEPATLASWLSVTPDPESGSFAISADENAIEDAVATLPEAVEREPSNAHEVVNNAGAVLRTASEGKDGRQLASTAGIAAAFAAQLATGNAAYALEVESTPFETTTVVRLLEVDLSDQRLYLKENGEVVDSWLISSGQPGWSTNQGHFTINYKLRMQDMGNETVGYLQPDVEWVMYFSGDQAFHAVYWRDIWGVPLSHGCVGMPTSLAKYIYDWADVGTDVWVHA